MNLNSMIVYKFIQSSWVYNVYSQHGKDYTSYKITNNAQNIFHIFSNIFHETYLFNLYHE